MRQQAFEKCFKNILKYDPERGSAFNYFTKITNLSLLNYTLSKQKHRGKENIQDHTYVEDEKNPFDIEKIDDYLKKSLKRIIEIKPNEVDTYTKVYFFILNFIKKNQIFKPTELNNAAKEEGIKITAIRNFRYVFTNEQKIK